MMSVRKFVLPSIFLFTGLFVACGQEQTTTELPEQLAGLYLVRVDRDEIARNKLSQMHHGANFAQYESVIGTYRDQGVEAMVYLTMFDSEEKSAEMMSRMVENIKMQKSPEFSYVKKFERKGKIIHSAAGAGQSHYFFRNGKKNVWISAPTTVGESVLNDFLN
jgi:hypothetical protein